MIEIVENLWIPMSDGVRLAAKAWLPADARRRPVPAVLEFIPYRKRDACAIRDHSNHAYLAARGYACVRPDMRGHGDSEGIMLDEYLPREQQDAVEVIAWIAAQPWCDSHVGMMGLSWGAIASLQAATRRPPALGAIIAVGGSVDRYYDDGGYLLGCYPGQGLGWGGVMAGYCARPPDPAVVGDGWREQWMRRLEHTPLFVERWLGHQLRDQTWIQGSVCEMYDAIEAPVLAVSGWNDCWPNTVTRLLENLAAPCRAVSGPWGHVYPHLGGPGPGAGFLQLAARWWDHWLKGIDNGVMEAPAFLAYIQASHRPDPHPTDRPGHWVAEPRARSPNIHTRLLHPTPGGLAEAPAAGGERVPFRSPLATGLASGEYMPIAGTAELPPDQRVDDARSLCFDTAPLGEALVVLGTPHARLRLASDRPSALVAARLCDVAPDGASTLISFGILNLRLRDGRERLAPIVPGAWYDVTVRLNDVGYALAPGNRLRLALSTSYWPMAWPTPDAATLTLALAASRLELPVRLAGVEDAIADPLGRPEAAPPPSHTMLHAAHGTRRISEDIATATWSYVVENDGGVIRFRDTGLEYAARNEQRYTIREGDPLSATAEYRTAFGFVRDDWRVRTETELIARCDRESFILSGEVRAFEGEKRVFHRPWNVRVARIAY